MANDYVVMQKVTADNKAEVIGAIVDNLRVQDKEELTYCGIEDVAEALAESVEQSAKCYVAKTSGGEVLCIFGVSTIEHPELGRPVWLIGSELLTEYSREFVVHGRQVMARFLERYGQLYNYVSVTNTKSIRWLRSLGATFYKPIRYGSNGEQFMLFIIERK